MRRSYMKRTPMKAPKRAMRQVSPKQSAKNAARSAVIKRLGVGTTFCMAYRFEAPGGCWGPLTTHEPWTRARGGPIDDPRNMVRVCLFHNTQISQDAETMKWAYGVGMLIHAWEGPSWLERGGFVG